MAFLITKILIARRSVGTSFRDNVTNGVFKHLVMAPLMSHFVQELFMPAEVLDLNEHIPPNGGFMALQWNLGPGRAIDG